MKPAPFVSILVPTRDRRAFIPQLLRCYRQQSYALERTELVVLDTGDDPVGDLLDGVRGVRYLRLEGGARPIGFLRNRLAREARGDIVVHMDDDDYYPPARVGHAVQRLNDSGALLAGSSVMYVYFALWGTLARTGPFGASHATAATLAYKREYLEKNAFDDAAMTGEEPAFTAGFTNPMVQLDPLATILCIAHGRNTYDKSSIRTPAPEVTLKRVVPCKASLSFYRYQLPKLLGFRPPHQVAAG